MRINYIKGILLLSTLPLMAACDDFLDEMPDNRAEVNTAEKVTSLLVSAYPTHSAAMIKELSSDNAVDNGASYSPYNQEQEDAYRWEDITTTGNDAVKGVWNDYYGAIASANQALQAIEDLGNPVALSAQRGEALICRAFGHFELACAFCLPYNEATADKDFGVPYSLAPETQVSVEYHRGTLAELYKHIEDDLLEGLPLINDNIYSVPKYHFNKKAAYALGARFFLFYHKFDKAIECANVVLGANPLTVLRDWKGFGTSASNYTLRCDMYINASENANLLITPIYSSWPYVHGPYSIGQRYGYAFALANTEGLRSAANIWGAGKTNLYMASGLWGSDQKVCLPKFAGYFEYTDKVGGTGYLHAVMVPFTTDETLLVRAEAYALSNQLDKAVEDIHYWLTANTRMTTMPTKEQIVEHYSAIDYRPTSLTDYVKFTDTTIKRKLNPQGFTVADGEQESIIQCILNMRRCTTMHEGLRWNDVLRYGIEIAHNHDGQPDDVLTIDDPRRAIQIPQDVINAGLEPNPRNK